MPLQLEIISPEKVLFRRDVEMAVVPGSEGDIAAMPDRSPIMMQLRAGVVSVYEGSSVSERFFIEGGFADMTADRCTVLADEARSLDSLDASAARARLDELDRNWASVDPADEAALVKTSAELQKAQAEIEAASH